jgi:hypothetical protein
MKKLLLWLLILVGSSSFGQEIPLVDHTWTETDGLINIPTEDLIHFGQTTGRVEVIWTPGLLHTTGISQRIFDIPGHLGIWVWNDGVHGEWYNDIDERRLFRARWGLPVVGIPIKIVITWDTKGYAVIIDNTLRIHDWQTLPTIIDPDPDITTGVYGADSTGSALLSGNFVLQVFDTPLLYNACGVDIVGTINENVPLDNTGAWSQGIDPTCIYIGSATLSWVSPTENTDDTPYTDPGGYKIYYGTSQGGPYPDQVIISDPNILTIDIDGLTEATYYFVATAYNVAGEESDFSNETSKVVENVTVPKPPGNLVVSEDDLLAYSISQSNDRLVLFPVGTVLSGTSCEESMSANGKYLVSRDNVSWASSAQPPVVFATCVSQS